MRKLLRLVVILLPALGLVAATWLGTQNAIRTEQKQARSRLAERVENQADSFRQAIQRQILVFDQTLRLLIGDWQADPAHFDLAAWHRRAVALSGLNDNLLLVDDHGRIVQSTVPEAVGLSVVGEDYFRYALAHGRSQNRAFISAPTADPILREWHLEVVRWARAPDGSFAGLAVADWRVRAIEDLFRTARLGNDSLVELVGLRDGRVRAAVGGAVGSPDERISGTPMFRALTHAPNGVWAGPSAPDDTVRMTAFRQIPGRDLAVVVGVNAADALAPSRAWARQAHIFAGIITVLVLAMAGVIWRYATLGRRRQAMLAHEQAMLAAANAQLAFAKAQADAKSAQLRVTLEGMSDGISMLDGQLCLMAWNQHFADIAGVPAGILRVGLPVEEILRAQARSGQFGPVDVEAEVARRVALLRSDSRIGTVQRLRPDGHTIELRRNRLPDGGAVTVYSDVTARKQHEDALREARAVAESATQAKSRFVAIVSHEIRTPLNALLSSLTLLNESHLPDGQQVLLDAARQSGGALLGLINDILDMSRMEAGQLTLRPSIFTLRNLLDGIVDMFRSQAAERRIALNLAIAADLPADLYADPGRLRQVLINLLSNALKFGQAGTVDLVAARVRDAANGPMLRLAVRDGGPAIDAEGRARLFKPFSRLESAEASPSEPLGSGLGLAICRQIVSLMGGEIGCDPWTGPQGTEGNEFWLLVPIAPLPAAGRLPAAGDAPPRRVLPRTRVLLVEDTVANQLVTATLLRREGHLVDIAGNGPQALRMIAQAPYDLVFLDIFMPGLTGYDVARRIRALPPPAGTMPLVALTANVSPDDQALCREAGMNRLLGKPVSLPEMTQALADLVWRGFPRRTAETRASAPAVPATPLLAAPRIEELRGSLPGDMLNGMVEECLVDLQARLPGLRRAMEARDATEIAAQAHAMVGMAAGYGMASLERRLRDVMEAARGGDTGRVAALLGTLDGELSLAAAALREALAIELV